MCCVADYKLFSPRRRIGKTRIRADHDREGLCRDSSKGSESSEGDRETHFVKNEKMKSL